MRKPKFEMLKSNDGATHFRLIGANGYVLLNSRKHESKAAAIDGIADVMRYGAIEARFVRKESEAGRFFFQLVSPSGRLLGWSESYISREARDNAIVGVRRAVQTGRVLDLN